MKKINWKTVRSDFIFTARILVKKPKTYRSFARAFDIASDGSWLTLMCDRGNMMGGTDGSIIRRIDMTTGKVAWTRERGMNGPWNDPDSGLNSIVISPNGKYIVAMSGNSKLIVIDALTGSEKFRPFVSMDQSYGNWAMPGGLAFSTDGKTLVSRCGNKVLVWDASRLL